MARPERNSVDYFPFYCEEGKKMYYLEEKYGNDGFATFIKILRELAKTNYHYLDLSKKTTIMFLSARCKISLETLNEIISDLVDLEKFNRELWEENKIIWCQDFIDSIQDAYSKRKNKCITLSGLLHLLDSLGVRKLNKSKSTGTENTQSKVEYSKEKEKKENKILLEKETKEEKFNFKKKLIDFGLEKKIVEDFLKNRKIKRLANTETACERILKKLESMPEDKNKIMAFAVEKGWGGFEPKWYYNEVERNHISQTSDIPEHLTDSR